MLIKCVANERICLKLIQVLNINLSDKESKKKLKKLNLTKCNLSDKTCGDEGIIKAVVKAINTHIDNSDVCENGCWALWNMVLDNGKKH